MGEKESPPPKPKGSCLGKLMTLVVFLGLGGLGAALYFVAQPQDLSDIEGLGPAVIGKSSRDLKEVLKRSSEGGHPLELTESELNLYLRDTLEFKQEGALAEWVKLEEVAVRLEDDRAEVVMVRSVAGYPLTLSMYVRIEQIEQPDGRITTQIFRNGGPYQEWLPKPEIGGRFGQLPVPEGFLLTVMPAFQKLAEVYREPSSPGSMSRRKLVKEVDFIEDMARISIVDGKLKLDPAPNTREMLMPGG
jgi:hypothetical protein